MLRTHCASATLLNVRPELGTVAVFLDFRVAVEIQADFSKGVAQDTSWISQGSPDKQNH